MNKPSGDDRVDDTAAGAADEDIHAGQIRFIERYESELPDGNYEVLVGHRVKSLRPSPAGGETLAANTPPHLLPFDETVVSRQLLRVAGPRYTLPPDMLVAHFPPVEGTGEYESVLPHLVLKRKTLPWERGCSASGANDGTPWLALLVFHGDDVGKGERPPWEARAGTVAELLAPGPGVCSYPNMGLEAGESAQDACLLIDIPAALWARVAPRYEDLRLLCHGREVTGPGAAGVSGEFAVVVANRMPHANERCTAHLVSMEGLQQRLPGGTQVPTSGVLRLLSLAHWAFTSRDPERSFTACVKALKVGPLRLPTPTRGTESDGTFDEIERAFALGCSAKNHHTRAADRTVSWYHGPLVPHQPDARPDTAAVATQTAAVITPGEPVHSADDLLRFDPETGLLDVSYAAAWQLGRLLMLQNTSVATALAQWKHRNLLQAAMVLERVALETALAATLAPEVNGALTGMASGHLEHLHRDHAVWLSALDLSQPPAPGPLAPGKVADSFRSHGTATRLQYALREPTLWTEGCCSTPVPKVVSDWLSRLRVLHGVPAPYLVPDARSLPPESLRIFALDAHWLRALVEGAFSVGCTSRAVVAHDEMHHSALHSAGGAATGLDDDPAAHSGCLLHSSVVADWPRLQLRGYNAAGQGLALLRPAERLTPRIVLCLFAGRLAQLEVREPAEGLHFGFDPLPAGEITAGSGVDCIKRLRSFDASGLQPGPEVAVEFRNAAERVVNVAQMFDRIAAQAPQLKRALKPGTGKAAYPPPDTAFSGAHFASEMVVGVQAVRFIAQVGG